MAPVAGRAADRTAAVRPYRRRGAPAGRMSHAGWQAGAELEATLGRRAGGQAATEQLDALAQADEPIPAVASGAYFRALVRASCTVRSAARSSVSGHVRVAMASATSKLADIPLCSTNDDRSASRDAGAGSIAIRLTWCDTTSCISLANAARSCVRAAAVSSSRSRCAAWRTRTNWAANCRRVRANSRPTTTSAGRSQLGQDRADILLHRRRGQSQPAGDLRLRQSQDHQAEHVLLAGCQRVRRLRGRPQRRRIQFG